MERIAVFKQNKNISNFFCFFGVVFFMLGMVFLLYLLYNEFREEFPKD